MYARICSTALTVAALVLLMSDWSNEGRLNLMNDEEVEKFEDGVVISSVSPIRLEGLARLDIK